MNISVDEKNIKEFVNDSISSITLGKRNIENDRYHHNCSYSDAPSIIKNGILSLYDINRLGIKKFSADFLKYVSDIESHINGSDAISLAVVGLTDLYPDEDEYNPFNPELVDFVLSDEIKASRSTINYGNEFLSFKPIFIEKFKAIDIRLRDYLKKTNDYKRVIAMYEDLRRIAIAMKDANLDIPLREMSDGNCCIDIDKAINMPKILIKKNQR